MKKVNLLKSMMLLSILCGTVSANATTSTNSGVSSNSSVGNLQYAPVQPKWPLSANKSVYWPTNFPALGSDNWFDGPDNKAAKNFNGCGGSRVDFGTSGNPNYGIPELNLNYNIIVNVQNYNSKLRYDIYSKSDNKFVSRNVPLINGRNIISIQPSFINGKLLKDPSGEYQIVFKGIQYNGVSVNSNAILNINLQDTLERSCQREAKFDSQEQVVNCGVGGALFYHKAKLNTTFTTYSSVVSTATALPFEQGFSKVAYSGSSDPTNGYSCKIIFNNPEDGSVSYDFEHLVRLYASIDAYQINLNGEMSSYANPYVDSASSAFSRTSVTYDLHQMLWQSK